MSRKENPWYRLPAELVEQYGFTVAGVYAVLLDACPKGTTTVTMKQGTLAKKCNMSRMNISRVLKELEKLELIKKKRNFYASTYEIKPVIKLKGEWQQENPEEPAEPKKYYRRKRPVHDIIREQEMEEIHKYLDLVD